MSDPVKTPGTTRALPNLIFASRWLQLPLYIGLIAAQGIYVYHFWVELIHLTEAAFGNQNALAALVKSIGHEGLSHVPAAVLKDKLATAIIGISSIHLLKTFINAANYDQKVLMWQTIIHVVFLLSAMAIAATDRLMHPVADKTDH